MQKLKSVSLAELIEFIASCRRMKIPLRDSLAAVLPGLADISIQRQGELTLMASTASNR